MKFSHLLFAAVLLFSASAAPAAQRTFDLRAPAFAPAPTAAEDGAGAKASGDGLLRAAEAPATDAGALAPGDVVTLLLFDGDQVDLVVEEASATTFSGSRAFLARTKGSALLDAVILVDADGLLHARIQGLGEGRVLRIFPRGGATAVEESEPAPVVEDGEPPVAEPAAAPTSAPDEDDGGAAPLVAPPQSENVVDVLVCFDRGAKAWAQNNGGTTNFAETAVQNMNLALSNSDLDGFFRYRLVGVGFVDERDTDVETALNHATIGNDGWSVVGPAADACGADVATVLIDTGLSSGETGIARALTAQTAQGGARFDAINACAIRAVAKGETMTHEVGHNLGCGHANTEGQPSPGPQGFPYSSGYHFVGTDGVKYHTIMGYDSIGGESYELANVFSSPELTRAGVAAGIADTNDNRRVLMQTWAWAAGWRATVVPLSYDVFFSPESGAFVEGTFSVTLTPGRAGLDIRYTLDGSVPTLSSDLYTGPIPLTRATTIRAAAVCGGVLGPVCSARYFVEDLAAGLDTPDVVWSTSSSRPWTFQTDTTWDGVDAVKSGACTSTSTSDPGLYATVSGPTVMRFRWCATMHNTSPYYCDGNPQDELAVFIDGTKVWSESATGVKAAWKQSQAEIPAGEHVVSFRYLHVASSTSSASVREYAVWVDDVLFGAASKPPALSPATTDAEATATTFAGTQTVTITAPGGAESMVFYTTDGSDPVENGALYDGAFEISASTRVRAVAVDPGCDASVETSGMYLERHRPVRPGEWTADSAGLPADAAADSSARLIVGLYSNAGTQPQCEPFRAIAEDPAFTAWCAANGVYLLVSDTTIHPDGAAAKTKIFDWYQTLNPNSTPPYGPALVAVKPDGRTVKATAGAMTSGAVFGTEIYQGTVDSLVACLASIIDETAPSPPTATPDGELVSGFPVSVRLAHPNSSGTIRYTLDGSAPTRSSTAYTGSAISVAQGKILTAAVFPAQASGLSSPVLRRNYRTVAGFFGIPEDAFDWSPDAGDYPWRIFPIATVPTLRSGNNGSETYGPTYNSVLRATARAAGTLTFRFGDVRNGYNTSVFTAPDGTRTTVRTSTTAATAWKSLSVAVKPGDVLTWSREVDYANKEYEAYEYGGAVGTIRCGAFLRDFVWTPADDPPPSVGWFDVKWSSQGWGSGFDWRTAAGEAAAGGTWSVPSGDASSLSGGLLALGVPDGGVLRFTAVSPSAGGGTVTVDGKLAPVVSTDLPDVPSGAFTGRNGSRSRARRPRPPPRSGARRSTSPRPRTGCATPSAARRCPRPDPNGSPSRPPRATSAASATPAAARSATSRRPAPAGSPFPRSPRPMTARFPSARTARTTRPSRSRSGTRSRMRGTPSTRPTR